MKCPGHEIRSTIVIIIDAVNSSEHKHLSVTARMQGGQRQSKRSWEVKTMRFKTQRGIETRGRYRNGNDNGNAWHHYSTLSRTQKKNYYRSRD